MSNVNYKLYMIFQYGISTIQYAHAPHISMHGYPSMHPHCTTSSSSTPRHSGCILYQLPTHESDQHTPLFPKAQHLELVASTKLCPAWNICEFQHPVLWKCRRVFGNIYAWPHTTQLSSQTMGFHSLSIQFQGWKTWCLLKTTTANESCTLY